MLARLGSRRRRAARVNVVVCICCFHTAFYAVTEIFRGFALVGLAGGRFLDLRSCYFSGTLPAGLSTMTGLSTLDLGGFTNAFNGTLPLASLTNLQ